MGQKGICAHITAVKHLTKSEEMVCDECVKIGSDWVHLRTCQTCGATLCCDQSPNTHMTKHFYKTNHPVIISAEPDEKWIYCYVDDILMGYK